jgi:hypothetical protein
MRRRQRENPCSAGEARAQRLVINEMPIHVISSLPKASPSRCATNYAGC